MLIFIIIIITYFLFAQIHFLIIYLLSTKPSIFIYNKKKLLKKFRTLEKKVLSTFLPNEKYLLFIYLFQKIPIKKEFLFYLTTSKASKYLNSAQQNQSQSCSTTATSLKKQQKLKKKRKTFLCKIVKSFIREDILMLFLLRSGSEASMHSPEPPTKRGRCEHAHPSSIPPPMRSGDESTKSNGDRR